MRHDEEFEMVDGDADDGFEFGSDTRINFPSWVTPKLMPIDLPGHRYFLSNTDLSLWSDIFEHAIVWARRHGGGTVIVPDMGFVKWCVLGGQDDALTSVDARLSEGVGVRLTTMGRLKDTCGPAVIVLAADGTEGERVERYASKAGVAIEHLAVVARVDAGKVAWSQAEGVTALDRDPEWMRTRPLRTP